MLTTETKYPDFYWLNDDSKLFLQRDYLLEGVTAIQRIRQIAEHAERILGIEGYADKFYNYMAKGYYSLSTPIWCNFGNRDNSLPISCFGSYVTDSIHGIAWTAAEIAMMSKYGGGTSAYFGDVRPRGSAIRNNGKSNGSFEFLPMYESTINSVSQGKSRRGMCAAYIDIEHGDVEEWLNIHTEGNPIQTMYYGICVGNDWLQSMKEGDEYKRTVWAKVLQRRKETGIPYIFFKDNVNNNKPDVYKDRNLNIYASNMCCEIMLPSAEDESFVCCLSSINLLHYEEWKDTDAVETLTYFLDAVMTDFIETAKRLRDKDGQFMDRTIKFAERHRALGLGVLGWHSYLQRNMIPFGHFKAMQKNNEIFKLLKEKTYKASAELAQRFGEPELLKGYGRRNTTTMAIAPTKSSSFILGSVSPSIEPFKSNYYVKDLAKIKTVYKNPYLEQLLKEKGLDTDAVWDSILLNEGSVQHLEELTREEKEVFKTFSEISQLDVIQQAAQRQQYIDQAQSLNIMIHPDTKAKDVNKLYFTAAELGIKSLYYQFSISAAQRFNRDILSSCSSCEG